MMGWPTITVIFMIVVFLLIVGVDLAWALNKRKGDTISEVFRKIHDKWRPILILISFAMGLLSGHFWWVPICP